MSTPESQGTPDFSEALARQDRIIATERFLYDGDPRAVGQYALMRAKAEGQTALKPKEKTPDSRVVAVIDLNEGRKFAANFVDDKAEDGAGHE